MCQPALTVADDLPILSFLNGHFLHPERLLDFVVAPGAGFGGIAAETERCRANLLSLAAIGLDYAPNDNYAWIPKGCEYYVQTLPRP